MVKERARTQGIPPRGHGGCEHVVSLGSQVVGSIFCGNKYCPSGSHRSFDHFFVLCTAGPIRSDSQPLQDTPPPTLTSWAYLPSGGDTPTDRSSPTRGYSGRGESTPATAGSTLGPGGHTSISDTAPTPLSLQRATGSHRDTVPPSLRHSRNPSHRLPWCHRHRPLRALCPLRPRRHRSPRQQYPRVSKTALPHTRPPTKPGDRTPNPGAPLASHPPEHYIAPAGTHEDTTLGFAAAWPRPGDRSTPGRVPGPPPRASLLQWTAYAPLGSAPLLSTWGPVTPSRSPYAPRPSAWRYGPPRREVGRPGTSNSHE